MPGAVKARIVKIGNSRGIRIPKLLLDQADLGEEVELELQGEQIVIRSAHRARHDARVPRLARPGDSQGDGDGARADSGRGPGRDIAGVHVDEFVKMTGVKVKMLRKIDTKFANNRLYRNGSLQNYVEDYVRNPLTRPYETFLATA